MSEKKPEVKTEIVDAPTDMDSLVSESIAEFQKKLGVIKRSRFNNSAFEETKMAEIEKAKKVLAEKISHKDMVLNQELQQLNVELNKELSGSNEVLFNNNVTLDKAIKEYNAKLAEEQEQFSNEVNVVDKSKAEQVEKETQRFESVIAIVQEKKLEAEKAFAEEEKTHSEKYKDQVSDYNKRVAELHNQYFADVKVAQAEYDKEVKSQDGKHQAIVEVGDRIAALDKEIEKSAADYQAKYADKEVPLKAKKKYEADRKEAFSKRSAYFDKLESIKTDLDNALTALDKKTAAKMLALKTAFLTTLNEEDHALRVHGFQYETSINSLNSKRKANTLKTDETIAQERETNRINLQQIEANHQLRLTKINQKHNLAMAKIEQAKNRIELECNKVKAEQNCIRAVAKANLDFNARITTIRNEYALKNAEVEEIRTIQSSRADLIIDKADINYAKVKEYYTIANHFFQTTHKWVEVQSAEKAKYLVASKFADFGKAKLKEIGNYFATLREKNKADYEAALATLKKIHDLEISQLSKVSTMAANLNNPELEKFTSDNVNELNALHQQKVAALTENYQFIEAAFDEQMAYLQAKYEEELSAHNNFTSKLQAGLYDLNNRFMQIVKGQEKAYYNYLNTFAQCSGETITKLTDMNTAQIVKINLSMEENDQMMKKEIAALQTQLNGVIGDYEKSKNDVVTSLVSKIRALDGQAQFEVNNINRLAEKELAELKTVIAECNMNYRKLVDSKQRRIKAIEAALTTEINMQKATLNSNIDKSLRLKARAVKAKIDAQVGNAQSRWWKL